MKPSAKLALSLFFCGILNLTVLGQQGFTSAEQAVGAINELLKKNSLPERHKISSIGNDLIVIKTTGTKPKEAVERLETDGKSISDYSAFKVLSMEDAGAALIESTNAMVISTMKKYEVKIDQSKPYAQTYLLYFQNVQVLSWNYLISVWELSTWNYWSFSFEGADEQFEALKNAWTYLLAEVVKRKDLMAED